MAKPTAAAPLRAIQAFAAVVRAGSVVGASDALTVTASAVSHLLRRLETRLGVQLFTRHGRRLVLTADGERLAAAVVPALAAIDDAVGGFIRRGIELRISLLSSFAVHWLIPRLSRFQLLHPDIELLARMGVVVVDPRFIEAELAGGQLIIPHPLRVPLEDAYWLVWRPGRESTRPVAAFRRWLASELTFRY